MKICVCVKRVPASLEDIELTESGEIEEKYLSFGINEYDTYSLEEAVQLKENIGGEVIVVILGPEEANEIAKQCIAKGADRAIRIFDQSLHEKQIEDVYCKSMIMKNVFEDLNPDLIFTGAQSNDGCHAQFGVTLAALLGFHYASLVSELDLNFDSKKAIVQRELEGGIEEKVEISLPAVLTVQTGLNEPRYASLMAIRRVNDSNIEFKDFDSIGLDARDLEETFFMTEIERLYKPPETEMAEIFEGSPEESASKLFDKLDEDGLVN